MSVQLHLPILEVQHVAEASLEKAKIRAAACKACSLHKTRKTSVFGTGAVNADIMLIGEAPSGTDEESGKPFTGSARGELLKVFKQLDMLSFSFYACHTVCCRPPENRSPRDKEITACLPFLQEQVQQVNPYVIVCLGSTAATRLMDKAVDVTSVRGKWFRYQSKDCISTYHPAQLLQDNLPEVKARLRKEFYQDFEKVKERIKRRPK